jgi:hypothetical protein
MMFWLLFRLEDRSKVAKQKELSMELKTNEKRWVDVKYIPEEPLGQQN